MKQHFVYSFGGEEEFIYTIYAGLEDEKRFTLKRSDSGVKLPTKDFFSLLQQKISL